MPCTSSTVARAAARRRHALIAALAAAAMSATAGLAVAAPLDVCKNTTSQPDPRPSTSSEVHALSPHMEANILKITQLPPGVPSWHDNAILNGECGQNARYRLAMQLHLWSIAASAAARGGLGADKEQH